MDNNPIQTVQSIKSKELGNPTSSKDIKKKQEELFKEIMISTAEDYSESLDKCLETWNMELCMYNLGYAAYFINRGLYTKEIEDKWKEVFNKALVVAKKIEVHNFEEIQKVQEEINQKAEEGNNNGKEKTN